jgi:hypothetical protein
MSKNTSCSWSFPSRILEKLLKQVDSFPTSPRDHFGEILFLTLREMYTNFPSKFISLRPLFLGGCAKDLHYFVELVILLAREEGLIKVKFGHDAADCEHVDRGVIVVCAEDQLGGAVPAGGNVVRVRRP